MTNLGRILKRLLEAPAVELSRDPWAREEGRAERLSNLIRVVYMAIWLAATLPTRSVHTGWSYFANVYVASLWLGMAVGWAIYLMRCPYRPSFKYLSTTVDIVLTTAILFLYHYDMGYSTSLKAPPFMNYLLAICLTAFRFNTLLPLFGCGLCALAYTSLLAYLVSSGDVEFGTPLELFTTPRISLLYQFYRLAYLAAAAVVSSLLVANVRRLIRQRVWEAEKAAVERERREHVQGLLERYFSPGISRFLADNPQDMGGRTQKVTIMIVDVRGFTSRSERIGPAASVLLLNQLFDSLVSIVFEHQGTLDKFLGDGMLVVFGTPEPAEDDADRALRAARAILLEASSRHGLSLGIAIHTGDVIFGNIGSPKRMELTVIGDTVNTATRIEPLNKELGTQLILSETTRAALREAAPLRALPDMPLRGKTGKLTLFTLAEPEPGALRPNA